MTYYAIQVLGVITKASFSLPAKPVHSSVALLSLPSFSAVAGVLSSARRELGEVLSAFEFIDANSLHMLREHSPHLLKGGLGELTLSLTSPPPSPPLLSSSSLREEGAGIPGEVLVLVEVSGSDARVAERLQHFAMQYIYVDDDGGDGGGGTTTTTTTTANHSNTTVIMPSSKTQERDVWALREHVPVSLMQLARDEGGRLFKYVFCSTATVLPFFLFLFVMSLSLSLSLLSICCSVLAFSDTT
jgi:hypothetical protein